MNVSIEQLKNLIMKYDVFNGEYPENMYEGLSVYEFICEQLKIPSGFEHCDNEQYAEIFKVFNNE